MALKIMLGSWAVTIYKDGGVDFSDPYNGDGVFIDSEDFEELIAKRQEVMNGS